MQLLKAMDTFTFKKVFLHVVILSYKSCDTFQAATFLPSVIFRSVPSFRFCSCRCALLLIHAELTFIVSRMLLPLLALMYQLGVIPVVISPFTAHE